MDELQTATRYIPLWQNSSAQPPRNLLGVRLRLSAIAGHSAMAHHDANGDDEDRKAGHRNESDSRGVDHDPDDRPCGMSDRTCRCCDDHRGSYDGQES